MRVFLCSYNGFSLAIPTASVSSITLCSDRAESTVVFNPENRNTYISLPALFKLPLVSIRHGIILKGTDDGDIAENKTILLTAGIDSETEIPDGDIYRIPKAFSVMRFSSVFSGIIFNSHTGERGEELVLLLNPEQLVSSIQKESII